MDDYLVIQSPSGPNCEYDDGVPACLFLVGQREWATLLRVVKKYRPIVEHDYSSGGHGCILRCDLWEMMVECRIVETNPSNEVRGFIKKISDNQFLAMVRAQVNELRGEIYVVWDDDSNRPQVFRTREQALEVSHGK